MTMEGTATQAAPACFALASIDTNQFLALVLKSKDEVGSTFRIKE